MHIRVRSLFIVVAVLVSTYLLFVRIANIVHIFASNPYSGIAVSQAALREAYINGTAGEAVIPKRIHQIYHDWHGRGVPHTAQWMRLRASCVDRTPGWIHKLWSASESREFIQREYPWFLSTYDSYQYPVQRVDALKYFVLRHYGGIYVDFDNGCLDSLEPLRSLPVFTTDTKQGPLPTNIMGAVPQHPYFKMLSDNLPSRNWRYWPFPYITINYSSGRWFQTDMWERYHRQNHYRNMDPSQGTKDGPLYRVIMDRRRGAEPWVFWNEGAGLTWENWDNSVFSWMSEHITTVVRIGVAVAMVLTVLTGAIVWKCCLRGRKEGMKTKAGLKSAVLLLSPEKTQSELSLAKKTDLV